MEMNDCKKERTQEPDYLYLSELYLDDWEYALEMFDLFLEHGTQDIQLLEGAFKSEKWQDVKSLAHKLKASFSMVGYPHLASLFENLEHAALTTNHSMINYHYNILFTLIRQIKPTIEKLRHRLYHLKGDFFQISTSKK